MTGLLEIFRLSRRGSGFYRMGGPTYFGHDLLPTSFHKKSFSKGLDIPLYLIGDKLGG
jgi:hypothetical protein